MTRRSTMASRSPSFGSILNRVRLLSAVAALSSVGVGSAALTGVTAPLTATNAGKSEGLSTTSAVLFSPQPHKTHTHTKHHSGVTLTELLDFDRNIGAS